MNIDPVDESDLVNEDDSYPYPIDNSKIWKMRNGKQIKICDMTDAHLNNAIALCNHFQAYYLVREKKYREQQAADLEEKRRISTNPQYAAFSEGWDAGYRAASEEYAPDVGFSMPMTKQKAWENFKELEKIN